MIIKTKLIDYKITTDHNNKPRVQIAFADESGKIYTYNGSLDREERTSKKGNPYTFYGITKGTLETCGFDPKANLSTLADPENKTALHIGKEFTIEVNKTEKDGRTYEQVYKVLRDRSLSMKDAAALLGEEEDAPF